MKIHTTQNLNSFAGTNSTNMLSSNEIRLNYSEQMRKKSLMEEPDSYESNVSFRGKNPVKDAKKIISSIKKKVGEVAKNPQPESKKGDSILKSPLFDKILNVAEYETVVQASIAAVACGARALTINALPGDKENNAYASGHALASGIVGFITAFALTAPFKAGSNYVMKVMKQNLNQKTLQRLYPHLDMKSIGTDAARKPIKEWRDKIGNLFTDDIKNCAKLPVFKQLGEVSDTTFSKILKVDVDWASQKGKSFNEVVLKDGRSLYDAIDMSRLGFVVEEDGMNKAQILFKDVDKEYLTKLVADSKEANSKWGELDVASVFDAEGKVVDFRQWKDKSGNQWKLDLDEVFVSSPLETFDYRPRITGKKRLDNKENIYKFTTYQRNGIEDGLGTEITDEMLKAEARNDVHTKLLTWGPDLAFRIPIAISTVALIPWILKGAFNLEKAPKKDAAAEVDKAPVEQVEDVEFEEIATEPVAEENKESAVAFKGKGNPEKANWFVKKFGELYGKPLIESEKVANFSGKMAEKTSKATQHMVTAGSFLTSGMYVQQTLNKKELDPEKRKTLAINQALCFFIPTIAAYTVDHLLNDWVKKREYRYSGLQDYKAEMAKIEGKSKEEIEKITGGLSNRLKGVRILAGLATFTLIYRYATPVLITPLANKIGDWVNAKNAAKKEAEKAA